jgi:nucleoside-diphosphate-sugar epimerase
MKIAVTGANGFLGRHIVDELIKRNEEVRIMVRSDANLPVDTAKAELVKGDFTSYEDALKLLSGCDALIHAAAVTAVYLIDSGEYFRVNAKATRQLVELCDQLQIKRLVYISTVNTIGYGSKRYPATEQNKMKDPFTNSWYAQSKKEAEKYVEAYSKKDYKHVIILHPAFIIGDTNRASGSGKLINTGYRKRLLFIPRGGKNFVDVWSVAQASCNALTMGTTGNHYIIGGENLSFKSFFKKLKQAGGYRQKIYLLPDWLVLLAGKAGDILRFMRIPTALSSRNVKQLLIREYYQSEKSKKELALPDVQILKVLEEVLAN